MMMSREAKMLCLFFIVSVHEIVRADDLIVKNLNVEKYMGRWYQIAAFPTFFQPPSSVNTRATYTLNPNGTFNVLNESWDNGKRVSIEGIAYKALAESDEAKFKVKFSLVPFPGDYWVLYVDDAYQQALVGSSTKLFLWVLNRQPFLDDNIYYGLVEKAKEAGYDVSRLQKTPQTKNSPSTIN